MAREIHILRNPFHISLTLTKSLSPNASATNHQKAKLSQTWESKPHDCKLQVVCLLCTKHPGLFYSWVVPICIEGNQATMGAYISCL